MEAQSNTSSLELQSNIYPFDQVLLRVDKVNNVKSWFKFQILRFSVVDMLILILITVYINQLKIEVTNQQIKNNDLDNTLKSLNNLASNVSSQLLLVNQQLIQIQALNISINKENVLFSDTYQLLQSSDLTCLPSLLKDVSLFNNTITLLSQGGSFIPIILNTIVAYYQLELTTDSSIIDMAFPSSTFYNIVNQGFYSATKVTNDGYFISAVKSFKMIMMSFMVIQGGGSTPVSITLYYKLNGIQHLLFNGPQMYETITTVIIMVPGDKLNFWIEGSGILWGISREHHLVIFN